jgi:hypothetical protein
MTRNLYLVGLAFLLVPVGLAPALLQAPSLGEALDNTDLTWLTGGDADWIGQTEVSFSGGDAARSGEIPVLKNSWLRATVSGPGIVRFHWKVSSSTAWTALRFYVGSSEKAVCWTDQGWAQVVATLGSGSYDLKWDFSPYANDLYGYVDLVEYFPGPALLFTSPTPQASWAQRGFSAIKWEWTSDSGENVRLELWQGGARVTTLAASTPNDGYYPWFVPANLAPGAGYTIRIVSLAHPAVSDESPPFTIAPAAHPHLKGAMITGDVLDYASGDYHAGLFVGAGGDFTLEAWFNPRYSGLSAGEKLLLITSPAYAFYLERYLNWATMRYVGCLGFQALPVSGPMTEVAHCVEPAFSLAWHHAALVVQAGRATFYLDGVQFGAAFDLPLPLAEAGGAFQVNGNYIGALDELRISNTAQYSGDFVPPSSPAACDASTLGLWHFDELAGSTIFLDACGVSANTLTGRDGAHAEGLMVTDQVFAPLVQSHSNGLGAWFTDR